MGGASGGQWAGLREDSGRRNSREGFRGLQSHGPRRLGGLQSMGSLRVGHEMSDFTFTFHFHAMEKDMATHSSVLAWRIPGTGEPGGLPSIGSHGIGHD